MDNAALAPGSLLPFKNEYQQIANSLPKGGILIVLPQELGKHQAFDQTAALLKQQGKRIATLSPHTSQECFARVGEDCFRVGVEGGS